MKKTPRGNRLHIALFGRTNTGKSSYLNLVTGQDVAITSSIAGTTTDVVGKAIEMLPLGPVYFLDTAGLDDKTALGKLRINRTIKVFKSADIVLLVTEPNQWTEYEDMVVAQADKLDIPVVVVINKIDVEKPRQKFLTQLKSHTEYYLLVSSIDYPRQNQYISELKKLLIHLCPDDFLQPPPLVGDLISPGGIVVMVVPIDLQAPKGRLILPQVQTIRDALDNDSAAVVVKERELASLLKRFNQSPDLVVCDSQAVLKVSADTPKNIPMTTFSILFARFKGDLVEAARGAAQLEFIQPGDKILIAEACSHHPIQDDIGRVKIPRWIRQYIGGDVIIDVFAGRDWPENLSQYKLVIHCGGCVLTRREMLNRIQDVKQHGVSITNYGVAISYLHGVVERTLKPFPAMLMAYEDEINKLKTQRE
ncbi:MAG: [FeFe] hydrogenase H-cluster maturation GTPase HydF [bacterium]